MTRRSSNKFGFIVHCRDTSELRKALIRFRLSPLSLLPEMLLRAKCLSKCFVHETYTFREIISDTNEICQGKVYCVFMTPDQMLEHQELATSLVIRACKMAEAWGAQMIGLGAITAVVGSRGLAVAESTAVPVTTGNSLTVFASIVGLEKITKKLELDLSHHKIVVVGAPGSIALALTRILHAKGLNLVLVTRRKTAFLKRFLDNLESDSPAIEVTQDLSRAIGKGRIIFSATSSGNIIDPAVLPGGSIVFDIAQPHDVIYSRNIRDDILIIDAGIISLPQATRVRYRFSGWAVNDIPSCLGETITLTFEGCRENFSIGRELYAEKIYEIGELSQRHGFVFDDFRSFTRPISSKVFEKTKRALQRPIA